MDIERLLWAIRTALTSFAQPHYDPDDLQDLADFLASEVEQSNVILPTILLDGSKSEQNVERTIEDIEALPITSILGPHLVDMLDVPLTHIPLVIDEILDNYIGGKPLQDDGSAEHGESEHQCELCERAALLTDHHLIPRSEHDLFVKRGVFTLTECMLSALCFDCSQADAVPLWISDDRPHKISKTMQTLPFGCASSKVHAGISNRIQHDRKALGDPGSRTLRRMECQTKSDGYSSTSTQAKMTAALKQQTMTTTTLKGLIHTVL